MPYCITGKVHHTGVNNEKYIVELLNKNLTMMINQRISERVYSKTHSPPLWTHLGGTRQKADCNVKIGDASFNVSIKHHKKSSGTFDWLNTSKLHEFNHEIAEMVKPRITEFKEKYKGIKEVSKDMRIELDSVFNDAFQHVTSVQIKDLLNSIYMKYPEYVLINDCTKKQLVMYHKEDNFKEFVGYSDWEYYLKKSYANTSRMIWRRKEGTDENTNLRIRLILNNGINALFGLSSKNKTSIPCLKIQQDRVDVLLRELDNPIIDEIA